MQGMEMYLPEAVWLVEMKLVKLCGQEERGLDVASDELAGIVDCCTLSYGLFCGMIGS